LAEFIVLARNGARIEPREGYRLTVVHGEHPASATAIRAALAAGPKAIPHLDPAVRRIISDRA
jgi:hypothetical protein